MTQYYIITELERKIPGYDSLDEAIEVAEHTLPVSMNWEIREEDGGIESVVYTHYIDEQ